MPPSFKLSYASLFVRRRCTPSIHLHCFSEDGKERRIFKSLVLSLCEKFQIQNIEESILGQTIVLISSEDVLGVSMRRKMSVHSVLVSILGGALHPQNCLCS